MTFYTICWENGTVKMINQKKIPWEEEYVECKTYKDVAKAIREMIIRGAPAIGIAAAMGIALGALQINSKNIEDFKRKMEPIFEEIKVARPTAVNLPWAVKRMKDRMYELIKKGHSIDQIKEALVKEAKQILEEDIEINKRIGINGEKFLKDGDVVLTHCNAGALATGGYGTALGVIRAAKEKGKHIEVYADETRPYLQGARLTTWELMKDNIPVTLITDNMAGYFMAKGIIKKVIVGADRITLKGDFANKIGTYMVAVLAKRHNIPFYVAAPTSTIDFSLKTGADIPIEERGEKEVVLINGKRIAPEGIKVRHIAFDITPAELVTAIITEKGVIEYPFENKIEKLKD